MWDGSYGPAVSPQAPLIAHVGGNGHEIWITGQNGEGPEKVLEDKGQAYAGVAWSPTGEQLACMKGTSEAGSIDTISVGGGKPRLPIPDPRLAFDFPRFFEDGLAAGRPLGFRARRA